MIPRILLLCLLGAVTACTAPRAPVVGDAQSTTSSAYVKLAHGSRSGPLSESWNDRGDDLTSASRVPGQTTLASLPRIPQPTRPRPAILSAGRHLECVPYARKLSTFTIRGDAWTWWTKAKGQYRRGAAPQPGAVIVLSKTKRLRAGHLAYVAEVLNEREILVHQANWLNRGRIHRYTPVRDVSENNDWSVVQVWYTPSQRYGSGRYPAYGFIYPSDRDGPDIRQAAN
ncbi:CHAP domain-containing protein [Pelagibius litoralis]|uniref:CHAP domain-containing protein n=1 Tax=Pelagibius litoralis TaxID=374515 RepID=A0A967EVM7_9PROT|nr:CHAP domain-containing protein [Pelagibius litoralis]NIA68717.1 CHAP domain-containing protein [Pelagibius litoralis]